jgi:hypothetical protein
MKKVLFLIIAVLCISTVFAQAKKTKKTVKSKTSVTLPATAAPAAVAATAAVQTGASSSPLEFKEAKYSFGKIKQGTPVTHVFTFKNTSSAPVFIESATAQCGCTTPEYPKGAIAKGATETIKVTYNAAAMGSFTKQVTVKVAKQAQPIILTIDGEVIEGGAKAEDKKG